MQKLKINPKSQEIIQDFISSSKGQGEYIAQVAKRLKCKTEDIRILDCLSIYNEEGWVVGDFLPEGTKFINKIIHSDNNKEYSQKAFVFEDFAIGEVHELTVNGKTLIADINASPWTVYINKNDVW